MGAASVGSAMSKKRPKSPLARTAVRQRGEADAVAWWSLLLVPALVPMVIGMVPFWLDSRFSFNTYVYPKLFVLGALISIALISWGWGVMAGRIATRTVPLLWPLLTFIALLLLSTATALSPTMAFFGGRYLGVGTLVLLLAGAVYFLTTQLVTGRRRWAQLSWAVVVGAFGVAAIGLIQAFWFDPLGLAPEAGWLVARGSSLFGNSDFTGAYLVMPAVIALGLGLSEEDDRRRIAAWFAFVVIVTALVNTLVRGAWIGVLLGIGILGVATIAGTAKVSRRQWLTFAGALSVPLILVAAKWDQFAARFADFASASTAGGGRLILWREAAHVIAAHPFFGVGADSYRLGQYAVRTVDSIGLTGLATINEDPHNVFLLIGATLGIPALLALSALVLAAVASSAKSALQIRGKGASRRLLTTWWAAMIALMVTALFTPNTIALALLLFLGAAMLAVPKAAEHDWAPMLKKAIAGTGIAFGLVALVIVGLTALSDVRLMQAQSAPNKAAAAAQAAAIAPWNLEAQDQAASELSNAAIGALRSGRSEAVNLATEAESRLRALTESNPYEQRNWILLASFLGNAGADYSPDALPEAVLAAKQARLLYPNDAESASFEAFALEMQGDHQGAIAALKDIWDVDPRYMDAGRNYVVALVGAGDTAEARRVLSDLQKRFGEHPDLVALRSYVESGTVTGQ